MDNVYRFNKTRWEALVKAGALFTQPWLNETPSSALTRLDPQNLLGGVAGKDVLCLAGGGGQQSVALGLNAARVSVFDISEGQLEQDKRAAAHYGYPVNAYQGDMRDLSVLGADSFDIVLQPYSLNFVPDCREVFQQVARILRPSGLYSFGMANPFAFALGTSAWNGRAFEVNSLYVQGQEAQYQDEEWVFPSPASASKPSGPKEYRQLLSTALNGLIDHGFSLLRMQESSGHSATDDWTPGDWLHFTAVLPPWFDLLARWDGK
jgi:ubiquinone/menaquinone biosynthesis C-methylase UbiE